MMMSETTKTDTQLWHDWQAYCQQHGFFVGEDRLQQCRQFYDLLMETNQHTNLTRITALPDFLQQHLTGSFAFSRWIPNHANLADVGSGGGFPGLPLLLLRDDLRVTVIESVEKKCQFIQDTANTLGMSDRLTVHHARCEDIGQDPTYRTTFDRVSARAVAPLPTLLELTVPLLKEGGQLLAIKGLQHSQEIDAAQTAFSTLKCQLIETTPLETTALKGTDSVMLVVEKQAPTPAAYPRKAGTPKRQPL